MKITLPTMPKLRRRSMQPGERRRVFRFFKRVGPRKFVIMGFVVKSKSLYGSYR